MVSANEKRKRLKELMLAPGCTVVPGIYDALSASIAEKTGFDAVYLGSWATAACMRALPDTLVLSPYEMAMYAANVANAVDIPLICDADNGCYHAANIWKTVYEFEHAGAAAIHIEDHEFGKHTPLEPVILDAEKMAKKIEAAVAARTDKDFMIFARSDVEWATGDAEDLIRRANLYLEAGADAVFLAAAKVSPETRARIHGPVVLTGGYTKSKKDETDTGINISVYWYSTLFPAYKAVIEACKQLKECDSFMDVIPDRGAIEQEFVKYVKMDQFVENVNKYLK